MVECESVGKVFHAEVEGYPGILCEFVLVIACMYVNKVMGKQGAFFLYSSTAFQA